MDRKSVSIKRAMTHSYKVRYLFVRKLTGIGPVTYS